MAQGSQQDKWVVSPIYIKLLSAVFLLLFIQFFFIFNQVTISGESVAAFFTDFHSFYVAGALAQQGHYADAYHITSFVEAQKILMPTPSLLTWTYPPQFGLLVSLLPFFSVGVAYGIFTLSTFGAFFITFRQLAGKYWATILFIAIPALMINFAIGQNGFLTGFLFALFCLLYPRNPVLAGIPLGLMIIKPHLALGIGVYLLFSKQWKTLAVAMAIVGLTSVLATAVFGWSVWPAFYDAVKELSAFMQQGRYPFFRMTSAYAFARSIGAPHQIAFGIQILSAIVATILIWKVVNTTSYSKRESLGLAVLLSPLFSPYIYDYDQLVLLVALALLMPSLVQRVKYVAVLVGSIFLFTAIGFLARFSWADPAASQGESQISLAPAAPLLWIIIALIWFGVNKYHHLHKQPSSPVAI